MPLRQLIAVLSVSLLGVLFLPEQASALSMDYYTYNSLDDVVSAFTRAALIFSDKDYSGIFIGVAVLGFLFAGIGAYVTLAVSGKPPGLTWMVMPFIGMAVYLAGVVPKGTLMIYDAVTNRQQAVPGLPIGLVAMFGLSNGAQRAFIEMLETASGEGLTYKSQGRGIGFNILQSLVKTEIPVPNENLRQNLVAYINSCVSFEIDRPGSDLTIGSLEKTTDLVTEIAKANHPSIFVDYVDKVGKTRVTCDVAWAGIRPEMEDLMTTFGPAVVRACTQNGYDPEKASAAAVERCRDSLSTTLALVWKPTTGGSGEGVSPEMMAKNFFVADAFRAAFAGNDTDTAVKLRAGMSIGNSGMAQSIVAEEWLPSAQIVMLTIAIGITPFVILFIPTPIFGRVISVVAGLNIFLLAWSVTDAVILAALLNKARAIFAGAIGNDLGISSVLMFQEPNMRTLAAFGNARWQGAAVGMAVATVLVRIGGYAFAQLAGGIIGQQQSASTSASVNATPEGAAQTASSVTRATPDMMNTMKWRPDEQTSIGTFEYDSRAQGSLQTMDRGVTATDMGERQAYDAATGVGTVQGKLDAGITPGAEAHANVYNTGAGLTQVAGQEAKGITSDVVGATRATQTEAQVGQIDASGGAERYVATQRAVAARSAEQVENAGGEEGARKIGGQQGATEIATVEKKQKDLGGQAAVAAAEAKTASWNLQTGSYGIDRLRGWGYSAGDIATGNAFGQGATSSSAQSLLGDGFGPERAGGAQAQQTIRNIGSADVQTNEVAYRSGTQAGMVARGGLATPYRKLGHNIDDQKSAAIAAGMAAGLPYSVADSLFSGGTIPKEAGAGEGRKTGRATIEVGLGK